MNTSKFHFSNKNSSFYCPECKNFLILPISLNEFDIPFLCISLSRRNIYLSFQCWPIYFPVFPIFAYKFSCAFNICRYSSLSFQFLPINFPVFLLFANIFLSFQFFADIFPLPIFTNILSIAFQFLPLPFPRRFPTYANILPSPSFQFLTLYFPSFPFLS